MVMPTASGKPAGTLLARRQSRIAPDDRARETGKDSGRMIRRGYAHLYLPCARVDRARSRPSHVGKSIHPMITHTCLGVDGTGRVLMFSGVGNAGSEKRKAASRNAPPTDTGTRG
jgi:hypothetical protein